MVSAGISLLSAYSILTEFPGQWHGPVPLPPEKKLETLAQNVPREDKEMFINFLECVLTWLPEDRLTSLEAYFHPWVRGEKVSQGGD